MARRVAVIAGASGLVGGRLASHLCSSGEWKVFCLSRSPPPEPRAHHIAVDLLDPASCAKAASALTDVTHVVFAARAIRSEAEEERRANAAMLVNLVSQLEPRAEGLEHICLVHGTKWYGSHLGPYRTPAREDDPRATVPNFYHDQLDWLATRQLGRQWHWSTLRPHIVCGVSVGTPFNLITTLGVYATLCRETGRPLTFPGTDACFSSVSQATDLDLLVEAVVWAMTNPDCANQSFNVVNADYFRWCDLWPCIAEVFELPVGGVEPRSLAMEFRALEPVWEQALYTHGLTPRPLNSLANGAFADFLFSAGWDDMSSTAKLRRYGFSRVVETEAMFKRLLTELRTNGIVP